MGQLKGEEKLSNDANIIFWISLLRMCVEQFSDEFDQTDN